MRRNILIIAVVALCVGAPAAAALEPGGQFPAIKAKTFSKAKFSFPSGLSGTRLNVLFLAMSDDQDNGQYQQSALLDWQAALEARNAFGAGVTPYHFPVLKNPPFFVKGLIAGAMRDAYEGKVPLDQAAILYVDDLDEFAGAAKLTLDQQPTIVIAGPDGEPLDEFKGEVTDAGVDAVLAALAAHAGSAP